MARRPFITSAWVLAAILAAYLPVAALSAADREPDAAYEGQLPDGALWRARVPHRWNGTLLLYSHGYAPTVKSPLLAPPGLEDWLLDHGYALAASSYATGGWAVADAVPDQRATLAAFIAQSAKPALTLAWGDSMGGLVTIALAESAAVPVQGAVTTCGSIAGTLAMMNTALDGAFAFVTLAAPGDGIRLVGVDDDALNARRVSEAVRRTLTSPEGRARIGLAGVLGGLPAWTDPAVAEPSDADPGAQLEQLALALGPGLFPPRTDQERRAGGVFSWNTGIDYRTELRRSGRWQWVARLYEAAHLNLEEDLRRLNAAPRIVARPEAVQYMRAYYAPTARPRVPVLSVHTTGDGLTSPVLQAGYALAATQRGGSANFRATSVQGAGHCRFQPSEYIAALHTVEARIKEGEWSADPAHLNTRAAESGLGPGRFIAPRTAPLLRACWAGSRCAGEALTHSQALP